MRRPVAIIASCGLSMEDVLQRLLGEERRLRLSSWWCSLLPQLAMNSSEPEKPQQQSWCTDLIKYSFDMRNPKSVRNYDIIYSSFLVYLIKSTLWYLIRENINWTFLQNSWCYLKNNDWVRSFIWVLRVAILLILTFTQKDRQVLMCNPTLSFCVHLCQLNERQTPDLDGE